MDIGSAEKLPAVAQKFSRTLRLMGNAFTITVVADDAEAGAGFIDLAVAEIKRIEALLTTFSEDSQTSQINRNAGIAPVAVDAEVFRLIERSIAISGITQGAFDITYGGLDKSLWNFDRNMTALPDAATARKMVHLIDYRNIELDPENCTVFLRKKGMRIGFGGIGKGYAADRARRFLKSAGVSAGIINASGDLATWGMQPDGRPWTVGISNPDNPDLPFSYLNISDKAIATSGNYEKFVMIGGKKYSHTIDPKTGMPVHGIKSVTVICDSAEFADAMATPVSVMGVRAGLFLIDQVPGLHAIVIDDDNRVYTSKNINLS